MEYLLNGKHFIIPFYHFPTYSNMHLSNMGSLCSYEEAARKRVLHEIRQAKMLENRVAENARYIDAHETRQVKLREMRLNQRKARIHVKNAAIKIQRWFRKHLKLMGCMREEQEKMHGAVLIIQDYWLGILKVRAAKSELQRRKLIKKQKKAATTIQRYAVYTFKFSLVQPMLIFLN
jgi:hypothetical protein